MVWTTGLLIAILVLSADLAARQPVDEVSTHMLTAVGCLLLAPGFAFLQSFVTVRRWRGRHLMEHRVEFLRRSLLGCNLVIWLFGCVSLLVIAKWPQLIRENWGLGQIPLLDELALAIPMLGSVLLSWIVIYDAENALKGELETPQTKRSHLALSRLRTFGGLVLAPLAMLFLSRDLLAMWYPEGLSPLGTCMSFIVFLVVLLGVYPLLLSMTWKTRRVEDAALRSKLEKAAKEAGLANEQFRVWDTDSTITNALVVGVIPGLRRVFLSDQLLERFDQDEVVAVYRHELGHVVYNHLHMRLAMVLVPLLAISAVVVMSGEQATASDYANNGMRLTVWFACMLAFLLYASKVVTRFIRRSEVQADLFAISRPNGKICIRRAEVYCQALLKMGAISPELYEQSTAAHPSIVLRTQVIRQVVNQPEQASKFHRRFRSEQQIAAACLVALVVFAVLVGQII